MWIEIAAASLGVVVLAFGLALGYGAWRWRSRTAGLTGRLKISRAPRGSRYEERDIATLPPPVQRYFRATLTAGQRLVRVARIVSEGEFGVTPQVVNNRTQKGCVQAVIAHRLHRMGGELPGGITSVGPSS